MAAKVDFSKLTLMDALDLARLIEVEAFQRYTHFAKRLGSRDPNDVGSVACLLEDLSCFRPKTY
jgi:hypothetical protein